MNCPFRHLVKKADPWEGAHIIIRTFDTAGVGWTYRACALGRLDRLWLPGVWSHSDWPGLMHCWTFLNTSQTVGTNEDKRMHGSRLRNTNSESCKGSYSAGQITDRTDYRTQFRPSDIHTDFLRKITWTLFFFLVWSWCFFFKKKVLIFSPRFFTAPWVEYIPLNNIYPLL